MILRHDVLDGARAAWLGGANALHTITFFEPLHHRVMASLYPLVPWVGVLVALALSGLIRNQLYGLHANDPIAIVASVLLLAGLAGFIPSLPANHVDPTTALRSE